MPEECLDRLPPAPWLSNFAGPLEAFDAWEANTVRMGHPSLLNWNLSSRGGSPSVCAMPDARAQAQGLTFSWPQACPDDLTCFLCHRSFLKIT